MPYLADQPEACAAFIPAGAQWKRCRLEHLPPAFSRLWQVFGCGAEPWLCPSECDAGGAFPNRPIILIAHAPQSQVVAARTALNEGLALPADFSCLALTGSGLKGQRGRSWVALEGNLHLTAVYGMAPAPPEVQPALAMLAAVAVADAIQAVSAGRLEPAVKWVNDVMLGGRKVAGVLTATFSRAGRITNVVFGAGVNVDAAPALNSGGIAHEPGCLAGFEPVLRGRLPAVFRAVMEAFDEGIPELALPEGRRRLFERYSAKADFIGKEVVIMPLEGAGRIIRGRAVELLPDLSLVIEGEPEPVRVGRMLSRPS